MGYDINSHETFVKQILTRKRRATLQKQANIILHITRQEGNNVEHRRKEKVSKS